MRRQAANPLGYAGAFEQLLTAFDVLLLDGSGVLLPSEVTALHQQFDRLTGVTGVASAGRGTVGDDGIVDDAWLESDLDPLVENRAQLDGVSKDKLTAYLRPLQLRRRILRKLGREALKETVQAVL
jgi:hypothetical protein